MAGEELGTFAVRLWLKQGTRMQHVHTPGTHAYPRDPLPYHETDGISPHAYSLDYPKCFLSSGNATETVTCPVPSDCASCTSQ